MNEAFCGDSIRPVLGPIASHVEVLHVPFEKLGNKCIGEPGEKVRGRPRPALAIQRECYANTELNIDADMGPGEIRQYCPLDETSSNLVKTALQQMQLGARAYHHILKLARTIADLAAEAVVQTAHIAGAIQYRPRSTV